MLFRKRKDKYKEEDKKYIVTDLYIGQLGFVTEDEEYLYNMKIETKKNAYIIYRIKYGLYDEKTGYDILKERSYDFYHHEDWLNLGLKDKYAIYDSQPLGQYLSEPKLTITTSELEKILKTLNEPEVIIENSDVMVTDSILKTILETNEMVKEASIDEELKQSIVNDLKELGEYYVNVMTNNYQINNNDLTLEDNYSVRMYVIKKLVEIETKLKSPELIQAHSLKNQYKVFQKKLN